MQQWLEHLLHEQSVVSLDVLVRRLLIAFALGCVGATMHYLTTVRGTRRTDRSFLATLVLLSVLIALVTLVIGDNTARAFSLVGTLAIVRFRTVVEDTRDTAFVIYAVAAGLAVGSGYAIGPIVCTPLVFLAAWVFRPRHEEPITEGTLILRLGAGVTLDERVQAVLQQQVGKYRLKGLSTARGGSALDATFVVHLPAPEKVFALVNTLSRIDGVQGVEVKEG